MSVPVKSVPTSLKMARSPIFYTGKNNAQTNDTLDYMSLGLKVWSGRKSLVPSVNNYSLSKNTSINQVINFEVSNLIKSEFLHDFDIYNDIGYSQSPAGEMLWTNGTGEWKYSDNGAAPVTAIWEATTGSAFLTTSGWSPLPNVGNTAHTSAIVCLPRTRYVLSSNYESLAIYNSSANEFTSITITWNNGDSDTFYNNDGSGTIPDRTTESTQDILIYAGVGPANLNNNAGLDASILPQNHTTGDYYDVILKDAGDSVIGTVRYELTCEPKYTPYQIAFVNRYGVTDFITFFKASTEAGNFTNSSFKKSIYQDGFTTVSLQGGQYEDFNINSQNSITMNTGWVDENYAEVIQDIMMSEQVAVLVNGSWIAVNPTRGTVEYQKSVNVGVINYTVIFTFAFNQRPLIK
tara:strand:- start:5429 stop:6646 length:1218 start_codon:yes stop_codon:yes gene_type:complete